MTPRHLTALNRTFLAVAGLASLGFAVLLASVHRAPAASWWPDQASRAFGSATEVLAELRAQEWWPACVVGAATVASSLLALWCLRQASRGTRAKLPLATRDAVTLRRALERAVTEEALTTSAVDGCRSRITRDGRDLRLRMTITLQRDASLDSALPALDLLLARLNETLTPQQVRADIHFVSARNRLRTRLR
ncbi:hypothetical protein [Streptomyces sp. NPDC002057]|uniref:hypothetical protein n=1 Tax=Streptomyces sp. NPDC002057 TaxID=3154664 RepID=UPI00332CCA68